MTEERLMQRCLELAEKGAGFVEPNPYVGCVIVHDGKIVSEGFHEYYGSPHAEVNAIRKLPGDINPKECTLYVNLEPCSHFGKTPPCADLIVEKGFKKAVIGNIDPNPLVQGRGIKKLKEAGIEVVSGVMEKEGEELNRRFFYTKRTGKPWITLKWAQTADGFISKLPPVSREENKITCHESDVLVHRLRARHQAILVGKNTVLTDNPRLDVRLCKGRNPARIVLGYDERMKGMHICNEKLAPTFFIVKNNADCLEKKILKLDLESNPEALFDFLKRLGLESLLVEGGRKALDFFLFHKFFNEIFLFISNSKKFGTGLTSPNYSNIEPYRVFNSGSDTINVFKN
ncbi:MAG: bifunctional diaminohydroxyphosphoribosylaminopyrimidine deaminase/5-amino-6-(5-phosphoribosylamino)uracil reductase RibD [Bacteroidia bacterium]|nr:bifunctional diaminohydroxyphosphoribosylaminopyrimidine deaminase/5-amino-6-(5-phosphoribosylamino)uracil reductase RibD [Bacteroidia bacterium]